MALGLPPIKLSSLLCDYGSRGFRLNCFATWFPERDFYCTVRVVLPLMDPDFAVMVTFPREAPLANPLLSIVATAVSLDVHVAESVMSVVVLFEYVAIAVNCCVAPRGIVASAGVTE